MSKAAVYFAAAVSFITLLCGAHVYAAEEDSTVIVSNGGYSAMEGSSAKLEVGEEIIYPEGLGSYSTNYFTLNGNTAYCLESALGTPDSGNYAAEVLSNEIIRKGLYYGMGGPGEHELFSQSQLDDMSAYILTHIALSYFFSGDGAFTGCTQESLENSGVWNVINWIQNAPPVPETGLSFSPSLSEAVLSGTEQTTGIITMQGDVRNSASFQIPAEITFYNEDTGEEQQGGTVSIAGGTKFRLKASPDYAGVTDFTSIAGSITHSCIAVIVRTGDNTQAVGTLEYSPDTASPTGFQAVWKRNVTFLKTDAATGKAVPEAALQILDSSGAVLYDFRSSDTEKSFRLLPGSYRLHETAAPAGYMKSQDIEFTVDTGESSQKVVMNEDFIKVLIGKQDSSDHSFLEGARLQLIDEQGNIAAEWTTGTEEESIFRIKAGTYVIHEASAPEGYETAADMKITVLDTAEEQHFTMEDSKIAVPPVKSGHSPGTVVKEKASVPLTGDDQQGGLFLLLMTSALAGTAAVLYRKRHAGNHRPRKADN